MAGMEQPLADMRANEAGAARDEEIHARRLPCNGVPCRVPDNGARGFILFISTIGPHYAFLTPMGKENG